MRKNEDINKLKKRITKKSEQRSYLHPGAQ